jgi:hypothetical protein
VTGTLTGEHDFDSCFLDDIADLEGHVENCGLAGDLDLAGPGKISFVNCYTHNQDDPAVIDMGGSGVSVSMPGYAGLVTFENLSDVTQEIGIGLNAGAVTLDTTISAGTIIVSGVGNLTDNSIGGTVDSSSLVTGDEGVAQSVWAETVEGALTYEESMRIMFAVLAGLSSGGGTGVNAFRDYADSKNRVAMSVDVNGNRTAVITLDGS